MKKESKDKEKEEER